MVSGRSVCLRFALLRLGTTEGDRYAINISVPTPQLRSWLIGAVVPAIRADGHKPILGICGTVATRGFNTGPHIFTHSFVFLQPRPIAGWSDLTPS